MLTANLVSKIFYALLFPSRPLASASTADTWQASFPVRLRWMAVQTSLLAFAYVIANLIPAFEAMQSLLGARLRPDCFRLLPIASDRFRLLPIASQSLGAPPLPRAAAASFHSWEPQPSTDLARPSTRSTRTAPSEPLPRSASRCA